MSAPKVTEEKLREVRDDLVGRIVDQQKVFGAEPSVAKAEKFLDEKNVLQRVERDTVDEVRKAQPPKVVPSTAHRRRVDERDGQASPLAQFEEGRTYGP